jgi:hypothetical protein
MKGIKQLAAHLWCRAKLSSWLSSEAVETTTDDTVVTGASGSALRGEGAVPWGDFAS